MYLLTPERVAPQVVGNLVLSSHRDQLGGQLAAEYPRLGVALDAGQGTAAHGTVHMDVAVGEKFRAGADRGQHHQVAARSIDLLAAAHRAGDDFGRLHLGFRRFGRLFGLFLRRRFHRVDRPLAGAGGRQHRDVQGVGSGYVLCTAGADGQGAQAVAAADFQQGREVEGGVAVGQLVQRHDQRCVLEEVRRLGDFFVQLPVEAFEVVVRQLHHGDGEHAALELEHGVLVEKVSLAHGLPAIVNGEDL
ncbi:hypothetical protein D9M69_268180 [compost metagenome]